ncbi:thiamine pyrophosphate-binding protein [Streptomyces viridosporus]|uniref:thiamine pyrophosphate-binding protein n=1 Tax=Streptomyces viridosporus TaxID=67581 RepID=UPI0009BCA9F5|nr:thiamine pyrophosphate-binding protein [Streptomyces viridosporus]
MTTTCAAAVARALADCGIDHAFGLVGGGNVLATAALTRAGVHYTAARHEGGAMAMADAYFRATGRVAVCTTTHGPGLANTATALAEAAKNRSAVVLLCGDAPVAGPRAHDIDQSALAASLGVPVVRPTDPDTAVEHTVRAVRTATTGQCPVALFLPGDLTGRELSAPPVPVVPALSARPPSRARAAEADEVLALLAGARRPLVLGGLGAWRAGGAKILADLGDRLGALLATTVMANGMFAAHPGALGLCGGFASPPAAALMGEADVVLAFGTRLDDFTLHGGRILDPAARVVQITLEGARAPRADLAVRGDAAAVAAQLLDAVESLGIARSPWRERAAASGALERAGGGWAALPHPDASGGGRIDPRTLSRALAPLLPAERTVVLDGGHFIGWPAMYWPVPDPAGLVFTGAAFQSIGLGLAGAVGAAVGRPDRTTVAAVGDGGALMGLPELDTLVRSGRSALVVVYDDASYGFEEHMYVPRGADAATLRFGDTDFAGVARALGARAVTVRGTDDLRAVREWTARGAEGTLLLDCKVSRDVLAPFLSDLLGR